MNADGQPTLRVGSWILVRLADGTLLVCFTYVDQAKGLCAKGGPPNAPDLATRPSHTLHTLPWSDLRWRFLSADETGRLRLPTLPDWVRLYGPQPQPGMTWDPLLDDPTQGWRREGGSASRAAWSPQRVDPWHVGDDIAGFLRIEQVLGGPGRSGMGTVYVGHGYQLGGMCAVKTLQEHLANDTPTQARFRQEALTWIHLDAHDNVVQAHSWQVVQNRACLVMEYVDGGDLGRWIGTRRLHDHPEIVLGFAIDFCQGMIHAAGKGLRVHRDVKPQNCLITSGDRPRLKISDFGLARALDGSKVSSPDTARSDPQVLSFHATKYGEAVGTCTHMAPEQFLDARRVDVRADVYAFGVMLFQMITGQLPFNGQTWQEFHRLHATVPPPSLPPGPLQQLDPLIKRCLAKHVDQRFADFRAVRDQLARFGRQTLGVVPSEGREHPLDRDQVSSKASSLAFLGQREEALAVHEQALTARPDDADDHWIGKINGLRSLGRYEEALLTSEEAASRFTAAGASNRTLWWSLWVAKGEVLLATMRPAEALACFDRALDADASIDIGWARRAEALVRLQRFGEAADAYARLVQLAPDNPDDWLRLGEALRKSGREAEAVHAFDRAISLKPDSGPSWANRGMALAATGGQQDQETMMQVLYSMDQALAIDPDNPQMWFNKAMVLVFYRHQSEALGCLSEARRLGHPSAGIMIEAIENEVRGEQPPEVT